MLSYLRGGKEKRGEGEKRREEEEKNIKKKERSEKLRKTPRSSLLLSPRSSPS